MGVKLDMVWDLFDAILRVIGKNLAMDEKRVFVV